MKTMIIGQIHDSIVFDVEPKELDAVLVKTNEVMTKRIPKLWNFINVPLSIEAEIAPINRSWYEKEVIQIPEIKLRKK